VNTFAKRITSRLPAGWQQELKRLMFRYEIRRQTFRSYEPDFAALNSMIAAGDWVIDVGANIGHYTKRCSDLVGPAGRVIALEPVPETFELLAANVRLFQHSNVTLLNMAASDRAAVVGMKIPRFDTGLLNYYQANVSEMTVDVYVLALTLDTLALPRPIKLIKIDAEGHDPAVLRGGEALLARDHPILIVETGSSTVAEYLQGFGYTSTRLRGSPNTLFRWSPK